MNPPIRSIVHQNGLWKGIENGTVDVIGSDHAPHTLSEKENAWPNSPSGMPGVQTMLSVMLNHVNNKKLSLTKLVKLMSENPCKIYKIKNKGHIKIGYDADLTVIDLNKKLIINDKNMASKSGWSPYSGMSLKGCPIATIINGKIKMYNDTLYGGPDGKIIDFD
jgi:dihydroorotase